MNEQIKKVGRFITNCMGLTVGFILACFGVISSGHFAVPTLIISIVISIGLSLLIGYIIPVKKIAEFLAKWIRSQFATYLFENFVINLIYVPIITSIMLCVMLTMANKAMDKQIQNNNETIQTLQEVELTDEDEIKANDVKIEELQNANEEINNSRPQIKEALPKSLLSSFIISYFITLFLQPIYQNIAMKKYVYNTKKI